MKKNGKSKKKLKKRDHAKSVKQISSRCCWPEYMEAEVQEACRVWKETGYAHLAHVAFQAFEMEMDDTQFRHFVDRVYNELGLQPEPNFLNLFSPEESWSDLITIPGPFPLLKQCKDNERMSEECARDAIAMYHRGHIAQNELDSGKEFNKSESEELDTDVRLGEQAFQLLMMGNLSMVDMLAGSCSDTDEEYFQYIEAGQMGLSYAINTFIPKTLSFFAYATLCTFWYILDSNVPEEEDF